MSAYYNEIDPDAALILRALIADGVIAPGVVDTRSIKEVMPDDLRGYTQCHFFAGGGLWSVAARMAGWADERPIWTASCPCQPFSIAGKGGGVDDPRHLWPDLLRLASARRPAVLVGEQVAGSAGYGWFDGVRADLAREGFAGRCVDIPACAVDAPHIRQRLYWIAMADAESGRSGSGLCKDDPQLDGPVAANGDGCDMCGGSGRVGPFFLGGMSTICGNCRVGDALRSRLEGQRWHGDGSPGRPIEDRSASPADVRDLGDANRGGAGAQSRDDGEVRSLPEAQREPELSAALPWRATDSRRNGSWWADHDWIRCHDGKARRTQPGVPLLVDGLPGRVGLWRVAGNAISPVLAAEVIGALKDELDARIAA